MGKSLVRDAAEAFKRGQYSTAQDLYRQLAEQYGEKNFHANLVLCQRRLGRQQRSRLADLPHKNLRVAGVMDEFTFHSYNPECQLLQLHPERCIEQLDEFQPHLLFIESAWQGLDQLWRLKISTNGPEINACIQWCKERGIPTLFWNKEDPVHFSTFVPLAKQVDFVFTTDIDCIPKYKSYVGHERVFLLPFAAQPKVHNPVEIYERKDAFNFAGSYYLRYPERQRDFAALIDTVNTFRPVEIYDRNADNPHPHYTFPEHYKSMILGKLPFAEIDRAYKGYRYGINMNTIKQSQTMFARRVFELLASNTVVVSNFSRGMRLLFGDLVVSSDDASQLHQRLESICGDELTYRKLRLMGLRKVMSEHTYGHRLAYIRAKLTGSAVDEAAIPVVVFAVARNAHELSLLTASYTRQQYRATQFLVFSAFQPASPITDTRIRVISDQAACIEALNKAFADAPLAALLVSADFYGPHYLTDLVLASGYCDANAFGKAAHFSLEDRVCGLKNDGLQYRPSTILSARAALFRTSGVTRDWLVACLENPEDTVLCQPNMLATDEFHYCRHGGSADSETLRTVVDDLPFADQGVSLNHALAPTAERLQASPAGVITSDESLPQLLAQQLFAIFPKPASELVCLSLEGEVFRITSRLPHHKHVYLYAGKQFTREELNLALNSQFKLDCESTFELRTVFEFQDKDGKKISHAMNGAGDFNALAIPAHCRKVRFGLRILGPGDAKIKRLLLGNYGERPAAIVGRSPYLVLAKQYPAYDDLYRYGFLHSRVRAYRIHGLAVDVFRITSEGGLAYREFEGIDVASGDATLLDQTLHTGRYEHVLVHLLDENMWHVLQHYLDRLKVTVWVHGAEIQVWQRRTFEFDNMLPGEVERQKRLSDKRVKFWSSILTNPHPNLHLVFVSNYLKNEAVSDLQISLPSNQCSVISNFIDDTIFKYAEKRPEDRLRLLSIRPYAKRVYANDLTAAAIMELSKRPFFTDLRFTIVGDGDLFEQTVQPLRNFPNVSIEQRFLNHTEIAHYHQRHGIFLVPTRMDTQGVSRDEAMASGLVPITTNVAAVPEFVDDSCGMVVPPEDPLAIADAVEYLYRHPDSFMKLSVAAAQHVRERCDFAHTIQREIELVTTLGCIK